MENYYSFTLTCQRYWKCPDLNKCFRDMNQEEQKKLFVTQLEQFLGNIVVLAFEVNEFKNIHCHGIFYSVPTYFVEFRRVMFDKFSLRKQTIEKHIDYIFDGHLLETKKDIISWINYCMKDQKKDQLFDIFNMNLIHMLYSGNIFGVSIQESVSDDGGDSN